MPTQLLVLLCYSKSCLLTSRCIKTQATASSFNAHRIRARLSPTTREFHNERERGNREYAEYFAVTSANLIYATVGIFCQANLQTSAQHSKQTAAVHGVTHKTMPGVQKWA
ncbi:hypothetical protein GGI43DRAFT_83184 [Trichoderma evansii]